MATQEKIFGEAEVQLVTAKRLAALLGVSDQSIYNWVKKGMPRIVRDGKDQFDVAACKQWLKKNQADFVDADGGRKGGKRAGAGRKQTKVTTVAQQLHKDVVLGTVGGEAIEKQPAPVVSTPLKFTSAQDLLSKVGVDEISGPAARNVRDLASAAKTLQEVESRSGKTLDAAQTEEAHSMHMEALRKRLDALAQRSASTAAAKLALPRDQEAVIKAVIQEDLDGVYAVMAEDPFGFIEDGDSNET